jgi:flagellar L-ring protein precursor FlgH
MKRFSWAIISAGALLAPASGRADSIWQRREPRSSFLFYDERARRLGDVLTVLVQEVTDIGNQDQRQLSKSSDASGVFTFKGSTTGGKSARAGTVDFEPAASSKRDFTGSSQYTVGRTLTDSMTVTVVDVLPNGNLIIEGFRRVVLAGDERAMHITGIVRPDDISQINTISSQFIGNLKISYTGAGQEMHFVNQGYVGKLMNLMWPF